jgi:hypothetical protein
MFKPGQRIYSPNGNAGTVIGNMIPSGAIIAIKLDNGRQVSGLASLCQLMPCGCWNFQRFGSCIHVV